MVELVIPLAITVLVVQNGQGVAVLAAAEHEPPINAITVACGVGSMLAALVGTVSTCLTGPVNAIISGSGERHRHYTAGLAVGVFALAFGLFAPVFTRLMLATPPAFIGALAGLAMLRVLQTAFNVSFRERFTLGALVTFLDHGGRRADLQRRRAVLGLGNRLRRVAPARAQGLRRCRRLS